ncbi:MAG: hypothetical protein M3167_06555 [Acidobacteriota bacterium]|nr:hypothetical protein [Acidobacteriota bacterium]
MTLALREVDKNVVPAWVRCLELKCAPARSSLSCEVAATGSVVSFTAAWIQSIGEPVSAAPRVQSFRVFEATCTGMFKNGRRIKTGGDIVPCKAVGDADPVFVLQTDRGVCVRSASLNAFDRMISGYQKLTGPTYIKEKRLLLKSDTKIVTDGFPLTIEADRLDMDGVPQVISFEDRPGRPAGDPGRPGGKIVIKAGEVRGTSLRIQNFGEDGTKGGAGPTGAQGPQGSGVARAI